MFQHLLTTNLVYYVRYIVFASFMCSVFIACGCVDICAEIPIQVAGVREAVSLLRNVVDAKLETMTMIRQRLKEENVAIKSELETLSSKQYVPVFLCSLHVDILHVAGGIEFCLSWVD